MKPDLTYEQCRNLEKWGLDQTLREGDWYYFPDDSNIPDDVADPLANISMGCFLVCDCPGTIVPKHGYLKLPSAEQMIMFLKRQGGFCWLKLSIYESHVQANLGITRAIGFVDNLVAFDMVTEQALYDLCEKVFGGKEDGAWRIYNCDGQNQGYIVKADMEELLKLLAKKIGYRLVKEPKKP